MQLGYIRYGLADETPHIQLLMLPDDTAMIASV